MGGAEERPGCSGLLHTAPVSTSAHQLRPGAWCLSPKGAVRVPSLLRPWPASEKTTVSVCHPPCPSQGPALLNGPPASLLRNELGRVGTGWSVPQGRAGATQAQARPTPATQACGGLSPCSHLLLPLPPNLSLSPPPLGFSSAEATASPRQGALLLASLQTFVSVSPQGDQGMVRGLRRAEEPRPVPRVFLDGNVFGGVLCSLFPEPVSFLLQAQAPRRPRGPGGR